MMKFNNGIYVAAEYTDKKFITSVNDLAFNLMNLLWLNQIGCSKLNYAFHTTIIFSKDVPKNSVYIEKSIDLYPTWIPVTLKDFIVLPYEDSVCVAAEIESKELSRMHEDITKAFNLNHSFDTYLPHISLFKITNKETEPLYKILNSSEIQSLKDEMKSTKRITKVRYIVEDLEV